MDSFDNASMMSGQWRPGCPFWTAAWDASSSSSQSAGCMQQQADVAGKGKDGPTLANWGLNDLRGLAAEVTKYLAACTVMLA